MDFFKITVSREDFDTSDFSNLLTCLLYFETQGKILKMTKQNFFEHIIFYFLVNDMDKVVDTIENCFIKHKVKEISRMFIMGDIE